MDLSIVIPALNEHAKIQKDILEAATFLNRHHLKGEIIVVDDGSTDGMAEVARQCDPSPEVSLQIIRNNQNHGKGHAVRTGILASRGDYVMFADSGNCVPYDDALRGINLIKNRQCDIAHGSRKMPGCHILKSQNGYRRICSRLFHWLTILFMHISPKYTDTQCGFKIYRGDIARRLYAQCLTNGFMFDVETIMRAEDMGCNIKEFPVDWTNDRDSRLSPLRSSWRVLKELFIIKKNIHYK